VDLAYDRKKADIRRKEKVEKVTEFVKKTRESGNSIQESIEENKTTSR